MSFQPSDLANLWAWCKADADCYQDAAKTTPCTDGTSCWTWGNHSTSGLGDAVQATGAKQPTYHTGGQNG